MSKVILSITAFLLFCACLPASAFAEEQKIGYVNMREMFYEYEKTREFNKKLEKEDEAAKEDVEKKSKEVRKLRDELDLLSDEAKKKRKPELQEAIEELDEYRKNKVESFIRRKDKMFKEIREDILAIASEYAKKNEYDIVFDNAVFVYSSAKYDITKDVLKELNKK
ncbi:MAG: OmpH family outer membrane protein [Omnitrophica bacterium]|nr:OmpH family outer membrane protein [Candidatus Omnitrophota bacterium]